MVIEMLIGLVIFAAGLLGFDLLAGRFGRDSRDGADWRGPVLPE